MRIPNAQKYTVSQVGDYFGNINRTKNVNFNKLGELSLAKNANVLYSEDSDANFCGVTAVETDGTYAYVINGNATGGTGTMFVIDLTASTFSILETSGTNSPTLGVDSDMVIFSGKIVVSGGAKVDYIAFGQGQSWNGTSPITDNSTSYPHPLCVFENRNTLLVGNGNVVRQFSTTTNPFDTEDNTNKLTIPSQFVVTGMAWRLGNAYIATRHIYGGEAKMFIWNGSGTSAQYGFGVGADWIYGICDSQSSVVIMTSEGQLRRYSGGGFTDIANLPVYYTSATWHSTNGTASIIGKMGAHGMRARGDVIYMNIDGSVTTTAGAGSTYLPDQPSGLWCYDPNVGLYHKAGYNYKEQLKLTPTSAESSHLVFATPHQCETGDPVFVGANGSLTGINDTQVYYAIKDDANSLQLSLSPADALAGIALSIGGTVTGSFFFFNRTESLGQTSITAAGGLALYGRNHPQTFYGTEALFGGITINESQTGKGVLMSLGMGRNIGSFTIPRVPSNKIKDIYGGLTAFFDNIHLATDSIIVKARTKRTFGLPTPLFFSGSATWTSTTTFTVDTLLKDFKQVAVGDEIEVVEGAAAGYTAHITDINTDTSTYTVTIDETMPVSSGSFDFIADNWKKLGTITSESRNNIDNFEEIPMSETTGKWLEVKVELRGRNVSIQEIDINNTPQ